METLKSLFYWCLLCILSACNTSPKPIAYGSDGCHFCDMTIVDKVHGAEIVTTKGKVYKFDATECMLNFMKELDTVDVEHYLTTNYNEPETLIDATAATYLITEKIPSPMGAFLSSFETSTAAQKTQAEKGGHIYTWKELFKHLNL